tara:strand:+ start:97 stop:537 length:441 start_codon:yes stop_codon:yes gene_type:complete
MKILLLFNSFFFAGKSPVAPGTIGSFFALLFWLLFLPSYELRILFIVLFTLVSYFTISSEISSSNIKDPQHIVIDEVLGMWIALLFIHPNNFINIILAFVIFRLLDIFKPSVINRVENLEGAAGILLDDIVCGFITSILLIGSTSI